MCDLTVSHLYQWITEEMKFLPMKYNGSTRTSLSCHDLEFLTQGHGQVLWNRVIKHVHSMGKVERVRKNILIWRFKRLQKFQEIQKSDFVGNKLIALREVKEIQSIIRKIRENCRENEAVIKKLTNDLKVAECKRQYQRNVTDDFERRLILLRIAGEVIQVKVDLCNSSENLFVLERPGKFSSYGSTCPLFSPVADSRDGPSISKAFQDSLVPEVTTECKCFLDKCCSVAKDLLDEIMDNLHGELAARNLSVISEQSIIASDSNYWRFMECDAQKLNNPKFDVKKKELKTYIAQNAKHFPAKQMYEVLLELTSNGNAKMMGIHTPDTADHKLRLLGNREDHLKELKDVVLEKLNNFSSAIIHNYVAAAQERVFTFRLKENLRNLMSQVESKLKKTSTAEAGMQERAYELIQIRMQQASIQAAILYLKKSFYEIQMEVSSASLSNQLRRHDEQIKDIEADVVLQSKVLESLQKTQEDIRLRVFSNHSEVRKSLMDISSHHFMRKLEDFELVSGLPDKEILTFSEFPLEYLKKSILPSGKAVLDIQLLLNSSLFGSVIFRKEDDEAMSGALGQWVKATLGMAPQSSADAILLSSIKLKGLTCQLSMATPSHFLHDDQILKNNLAKIPGHLRSLDEDEKKWLYIMPLANNLNKDHIELTEKQLNEAESIYRNWLEGMINECIPESILFDGKNFQQWHLEVQSAMSKIN